MTVFQGVAGPEKPAAETEKPKTTKSGTAKSSQPKDTATAKQGA